MGDGTQPRPVGLSTGPFVGRQADLLAAAEILGAGAGVLVLGDRGVGRTRLLAELASRHAGLTCVYDVDLLDDGAADALALAVRGGGRVALTARSVDGLGGSLRSLVRSGALLSVRLRPLGLAETRVIVAHGLLVATAGAGGGPDGAAAGRAGSPDGASHVADRLVEHLFRHTAGNPGMVHDVLAAMLQGGRIERRGGVHTLAGLAVTSPRARAEQVRGDEHDPTTQPPQVREVLEILAIGEPLPLGVALAVRPALDLEGAEAAGALVLDPVVSEVSLPGRWESARVLAELESELAPRERLRLAWTSYLAGTRPTLRERARVLLLSDLDGEGDLDGGGGDLDGDDDAGEPTREAPPSRPTVEEALTLAEQLLGVDRDLTVRLTGHLRTWCTRPSQLVRLASLLGHAHRTEDSRTVLETLDLAAPAAEQLLGAELTRAFLLAQAESQPLAAIEVLDRATARFGPNPLTSAVRATALWRAGRFVAARALALDVIGDHAAPIEAVLHARLAHASSSLYAGTTGEVGVSLAWVLAHADEVPTLPEGREAALLIGLGRDLLAGAPVEEGATAAEVGYQEALRAGNDGARAQYAHFRALAQLLGARPAAAATGLEASAGLEGQWVVATRPWVDRTHVEALATAGRGAAAQAALAGLVARPHASMYELDRALAVAVVAATQGRVAEAIDGLARAARSVEGPGGPGSVAWTRYRAVTWGSTTAAHELARTRGEVPLNRGQLDHARALAAGSTAALLQAAAALSATGHHWYAAAAALQALERAEFGQRRERAQAWHVLAGAVREERVVLPQLGAVVGADTGYLLSGREREVAAGAASGLSNAALARALGISARTAETYLARVLGRLGISSRSEIAGRLALLDRIAVAPLEEGAPSSSPSPSLLPSWSSEKVPPPTSGT